MQVMQAWQGQYMFGVEKAVMEVLHTHKRASRTMLQYWFGLQPALSKLLSFLFRSHFLSSCFKQYFLECCTIWASMRTWLLQWQSAIHPRQANEKKGHTSTTKQLIKNNYSISKIAVQSVVGINILQLASHLPEAVLAPAPQRGVAPPHPCPAAELKQVKMPEMCQF